MRELRLFGGRDRHEEAIVAVFCLRSYKVCLHMHEVVGDMSDSLLPCSDDEMLIDRMMIAGCGSSGVLLEADPDPAFGSLFAISTFFHCIESCFRDLWNMISD